MTKKKNPEELKKAGKKEIIVDNGILLCLFKEVRKMEDLTGKCRLVISDTIKEIMNGTKEAYAPRKIFHIIQNESRISKATIKKRIEGNEIFGRFSYSDESVKKYKRVVLAVIEALEEELRNDTQLVKCETKSDEYLTAVQAQNLRDMISEGKTKHELIAFIKGTK